MLNQVAVLHHFLGRGEGGGGREAGARRYVRGVCNIRPFSFPNIRLLYSLHCR